MQLMVSRAKAGLISYTQWGLRYKEVYTFGRKKSPNVYKWSKIYFILNFYKNNPLIENQILEDQKKIMQIPTTRWQPTVTVYF